MTKRRKKLIIIIVVLIGILSSLPYLWIKGLHYWMRSNLLLQNVYLPEIPDLEYILYDIAHSADTTGYTDSYPYYYVQIKKSRKHNDSIQQECYSINIQWKSSKVCKNDSAIGYLSPSGIEPENYYILTSTDMDVDLLQDDLLSWRLFSSLIIGSPKFEKDTTLSISSTLKQGIQADTLETTYRLDDKREFKFYAGKYYTDVYDKFWGAMRIMNIENEGQTAE